MRDLYTNSIWDMVMSHNNEFMITCGEDEPPITLDPGMMYSSKLVENLKKPIPTIKIVRLKNLRLKRITQFVRNRLTDLEKHPEEIYETKSLEEKVSGLENEFFIGNEIKIYPWPMHLPGLGFGSHIKTIQVDQNDEWIFLGMTSGCIKVYSLGLLVGSSEKLFGDIEGTMPGSVYSENISPNKPSKTQI